MRVYVETTVWSFALADDSPLMTEVTREFLNACRQGEHEPVISALVVREIERADRVKRESLLALVQEISPTIVPISYETDVLAREFVDRGAVPPSKPEDAGHVAAAFTGAAEALVSWNFKHIASTKRAERFNAVALLLGYDHRLTITTPGELLDG